jgi:hypothetical protein
MYNSSFWVSVEALPVEAFNHIFLLSLLPISDFPILIIKPERCQDYRIEEKMLACEINER